ncbi:MAG TPA: response regulator transcription factor [Candidatus Acidoferrales bacterium]|nr:response regulator transcription factor [Candidatus Acidoferrales bacterium]
MEPSLRLLLVHGQRRIVAFLEPELARAGFAVQSAENASEGFRMMRDGRPHVVLLDVALPDIDGISFLSLVRAHSDAPVVMLGVEMSTQTRIASLAGGADHCVSLPASMPELIALLYSAVRRPALRDRDDVTFEDLHLDPATRTASRSGRTLDLTPREFDVLAALLRRPGRVVSRQELLSSIWGGEERASSKAVDACIVGLRRKIDAPFPDPLVRTIRGIGFTIRRLRVADS